MTQKTINTKHGLVIRGDSEYCPLSLSYDSYWNCLTNCYHCVFRRLNHIWGKELRPTNPEVFQKKLQNGLKNKTPKSKLAWALKHKKTIRIGNKSDPYQLIELKYKVTQKAIKILTKLKWSFVIQTRFTKNMIMLNRAEIIKSKKFCVIMPIVSPGLNKDWEIFERKRTTPPLDRLQHLQELKKSGINIGVNGEPFIPGFHTLTDFEDTMKALKSFGIPSYNTYNLHFNDYVAKKLHEHTPVDIEKIWYMNQDKQWKPILQKLIEIAKKYNINLGCPDFVNTGKDYIEPANTCCGVDVPNPCTFNTHHWKKRVQKSCLHLSDMYSNLLDSSWDGVGDLEKGKQIIKGENPNIYTLKDAGIIYNTKKKKGA